MDVIVKSKHTKVPEGVKEYARKKLSKLGRHLPRLREVVVEISHEGTRAASERYVVQVMADSNGTFLRAEERASEPRPAIDKAADVMDRQVRRHKQRLYSRSRSTLAKEIALERAMPSVEEEGSGEPLLDKVIRVKRFPMKPMSEEEALEQMELLGHDFFLFLHDSTNCHAVVYRRRDGGYGLILPEAP